MLRIGQVFDKIVATPNLEIAAKLACSTRKDKSEVAHFNKDRENNLLKLQQELINGTFHSSKYRTFDKNEKGKIRHIADLPLYPDRILHWAICLIIEPIFIPKLISQTHASIPGRGYHGAVKQIYGYICSDNRIKFAMVIDIHKFFNSILKDVLKEKIHRTFKDRRFIDLMNGLIDEWTEPGIPIGNRYSPILANLYLNDVMHRMKERYHVHYLSMFMDDVCILGYSKEWLHRIKDVFEKEIGEIGLTLKKNYQIFPIDSRGIPFLGYRIFTDHILLLKPTKKRMIKATDHIWERQNDDTSYRLSEHEKGTLASYNGVLANCDGYHLKEKYMIPILNIEKDREMRDSMFLYSE